MWTKALLLAALAAALGVSLWGICGFTRLLRLHAAAELQSIQPKLSACLRRATAGVIAFAALAIVYFIFF